MFLLALMPILVAAVMLVGFRQSARRTMPVTFLLTAAVALLVWGQGLV